MLAGGPRLGVADTRAAEEKVPITTSSAEARELYLKGRDLAERLRATDARRFYEQAVARDANFALGYIGLANTSGTTMYASRGSNPTSNCGDNIFADSLPSEMATVSGDPASGYAATFRVAIAA
jgi:hypothetical protein